MADTSATTDLLFRPALELAGLVRPGSSRPARAGRGARSPRIDAPTPELNASSTSSTTRRSRPRRRPSATSARSRACPSRSRTTARSAGCTALTYGSGSMGDWVRALRPQRRRARLRAPASSSSAPRPCPEWGILPWTNTKRCGATRNPWDPARTSGGSSGGSATAPSPPAWFGRHANDGGGSTRIPGRVLRPRRSRSRSATARRSPPRSARASSPVDGVLTRTVADTAAALDAIAGPEAGDAGWAPPPPEPFATPRRAPERLQVAARRPAPTSSEDDASRRPPARDGRAARVARPRGRGGRPAVARRSSASCSPRCSRRW